MTVYMLNMHMSCKLGIVVCYYTLVTYLCFFHYFVHKSGQVFFVRDLRFFWLKHNQKQFINAFNLLRATKMGVVNRVLTEHIISTKVFGGIRVFNFCVVFFIDWCFSFVYVVIFCCFFYIQKQLLVMFSRHC